MFEYHISEEVDDDTEETYNEVYISCKNCSSLTSLSELMPEEERTDILEVGQILVNEETLEYGLLQHIKMCLECNNESQAIRLLEKYGFEKQEERYSEEEIMDMFHSLSMHLPLHYEFLVKEQFKKK
jgi:predicted GNAT family N-acyltransferase